MKKCILEFIRRGLVACGLGPLVLAIFYLILQHKAGVETLTVHQVCLGIVSLAALAFIAGGMNFIYQIERLPLMAAILIHGVLRLIVDDAEKATFVLHQHGFILSMTPVSVVAVPDEIGGLAPVLEALAKGQMDVEYMYSLFTHRAGTAYMVFRVEDDAKFAELLKPYRIQLAGKEELGLK